MDVFHLAAHVFAGHHVGVASRALTRTRGLSRNHNPETLLGGIGRTGLCTGAVRPAGGVAPSTGNHPSGDRTHQGRAAHNGVTCSETFCQAQMTVESNLRAAAFCKDPGEGNSVFTKGALVFLTVDVASDFSFVAPFRKDLGVFADFSLGVRSSSQEMFEVQFDEPLRGAGFEKATLVFGR